MTETTHQSPAEHTTPESGYDVWTAPHREQTYDATVVVVTYDRDRSVLTATLDALESQTATSFEVVLLDNGTPWDLTDLQRDYDVVTVYVEYATNSGVNAARNLGADLAAGERLVFLDDDAVPKSGFVEAHCRAHESRDIVAARGRVVPKSASFYDRLRPRHDLGEDPVPSPIDVEGNFSIDPAAFAAVDGFHEDVWGHEGIHLTAKLLEEYDPESIIYWPDAVVAHEYVDGFRALVRKKARHGYYRRRLQEEHPDLFDVYRRYDRWDPTSRPPLHVVAGILVVGSVTDLLAWGYCRLASYDAPTE